MESTFLFLVMMMQIQLIYINLIKETIENAKKEAPIAEVEKKKETESISDKKTPEKKSPSKKVN